MHTHPDGDEGEHHEGDVDVGVAGVAEGGEGVEVAHVLVSLLVGVHLPNTGREGLGKDIG